MPAAMPVAKKPVYDTVSVDTISMIPRITSMAHDASRLRDSVSRILISSSSLAKQLELVVIAFNDTYPL